MVLRAAAGQRLTAGVAAEKSGNLLSRLAGRNFTDVQVNGVHLLVKREAGGERSRMPFSRIPARMSFAAALPAQRRAFQRKQV